MRYDISYAKENKEIVNFKEKWNSSENRILRIDLSKNQHQYSEYYMLYVLPYVNGKPYVNGLR